MQTTEKPTPVPFVDLKAQYNAIAHEVGTAIDAVLKSGGFILGREVGLFEEEFAAYCETQYAVGVDSGTSALELALRAYDIGPGDEVITTANTFIATALAISHAGAKPVLVDIDPQTYNMDVAQMEQAITPRTRAIMPVHLYGQPADMDSILAVAEKHNLVVIEDAAQAHGARYKGKRTGSLGHAAAFSFYPAKNLGAFGDGGIVVTSSAETADRLRMLRNYGQRVKYYHDLQGFNRRLDTVQAAVLRVKLQYLDEWNSARRQHADRYSQLLGSVKGVTIPTVADYAEPVWHLYVIRVADRSSLQQQLSDQGISTVIHYPVPVHMQAAYRDLGYAQGAFPVTEEYADQIVSLPMYAELTPDMVERVVQAISDAVAA